MKRTLLTLALVAAAGAAGAQTVTTPPVGGATVTPPSVGSGTTPAVAPAVNTPAALRSVGAGCDRDHAARERRRRADSSAGWCNYARRQSAERRTPGVPSQYHAPSRNAPACPTPRARQCGQEDRGDGYKNVQGLSAIWTVTGAARCAAARWSTRQVGARGNVLSCRASSVI
jgi:hypothetical protein